MNLIDDVLEVLNDLAPHGWKAIWEVHGLDINSEDIKTELTKELNIDRTFPGFEDFSSEGTKAVSSGEPARSLLYHSLASPNVKWIDKLKTKKVDKFPTLKQIETVENYVYAIDPPAIHELESEYGSDNLAIVIFANQYRIAFDTPHKKHADLVYSRTGVSRVGTARSLYNPESRSYEPLVKNNPSKIRVLPAKYNAYIAVKRKGNKDLLGNRFNKTAVASFPNMPGDESLYFWHPVQKLFNGRCILNIDFEVSYTSRHSNEKIKKIHQFIQGKLNISSGSTPEEQQKFPYSFGDQIAKIDKFSGLITPIPSQALVRPVEALLNKVNLPKTGRTPDLANLNQQNFNSMDLLSSSLELRRGILKNTKLNPKSTPEYMHIRTVKDGGNLNDEDRLIDLIRTKKYKAVHYIDFTGDGIIQVNIKTRRPLQFKTIVSAYSIIAPPDFFPYCDQAEIYHKNAKIWGKRMPFTLADTRLRPNIQSHPDLFYEDMQEFDTVTALIPGIIDENLKNKRTKFEDKIEHRVSYMSDAAAGLFAPGWDTSFDQLDGLPHLAAYGLGSPFPEDAKLCAALSSFWPAVAPDIARSFWTGVTGWRTVVPLTDIEIGSNGKKGWDGEEGPLVVEEDGEVLVKYKNFDYVDYTLNALHNKFNYHLLASIDSLEYMERAEKFEEAKQRLNQPFSNPLLISYNIITDRGGGRLHNFRFITQFSETNRSFPFVTVKVIREETITV